MDGKGNVKVVCHQQANCQAMTVCIADTSSSDYEQSAHMKRVHYQYVLFSQIKY